MQDPSLPAVRCSRPIRELRRQSLRLSGAQPPRRRNLHRREPQSRQVLQFPLHLLPDRSHDTGRRRTVDLRRLAEELDRTVEQVTSGRIYEGPRFRDTPPPLRRLNDIAFSGDGEPTACPNFDRAVDVCAEVRRRRKLDDVKLVLITNATLFHQPRVRQALKSSTPTTARSGRSSTPARKTTSAGGSFDRSLAADSRQSARGGHRAADRHPIAVSADSGPTAAAGRVGGILRSASRDSGGRRANQAGADPHDCPPACRAWVTALADAEVDAIAERCSAARGCPWRRSMEVGERGKGEGREPSRPTKGCSLPSPPPSRLCATSGAKFWPGCDVSCGRSCVGLFRFFWYPLSTP